MHGLVNRSLQCFVQQTFGQDTWAEIALHAGLPSEGFEALLSYEDQLTCRMIEACCTRLRRQPAALLEDLGTFLVSHPSNQWLRRLLRFGGSTFIDFLHSLDHLPDRARLAVPELDLPELELEETAAGCFILRCRHEQRGFGYVLVGVLRAMADDYGSLALLDHGDEDGEELITIIVAATGFSEGRHFELAAG